jgi:hypothetical protein
LSGRRETRSRAKRSMSFPVEETRILRSVQGRALSPHRDKFFVSKRVVHTAHQHPPVFFQPDGHAADGHAMGKVDCAIQRIHHPTVSRGGRMKPRFLHQKPMVGKRARDALVRDGEAASRRPGARRRPPAARARRKTRVEAVHGDRGPWLGPGLFQGVHHGLHGGAPRFHEAPARPVGAQGFRGEGPDGQGPRPFEKFFAAPRARGAPSTASTVEEEVKAAASKRSADNRSPPDRAGAGRGGSCGTRARGSRAPRPFPKSGSRRRGPLRPGGKGTFFRALRLFQGPARAPRRCTLRRDARHGDRPPPRRASAVLGPTA